ncbi:MAG: hypothetical protein IPL98_06220 [Saprospiraceae bacterium]|nr:hypothetical protein [Saprospiraceae bacterium]
MKKCFVLLIILVFTTKVHSQSTVSELIFSCDTIESILQNYSKYDSSVGGILLSLPSDGRVDLLRLYNNVKKLVDRFMFVCDNRLKAAINKAEWLTDYYGDIRYRGFEDIGLSEKYCGLSGVILLDSLYNDESDLILYVNDQIDSTYLMNKVLNEKDLEKIDFIVNNYYNNGFESPDPTQILHLFTSHLETYSRLFSLLREKRSSYTTTDTTLKVSEKKYFEENMNLNDSDVMYVYKHIILDMPTAEETLYWEEQRKEYLEFEQLHLIMLDSLKKIHLYEDSLRYVHYLDTLSGQAKLEYLIWHDSTLVHMDGRMRTVAIADDGYRFDTLSNEDLINRFQMLNFDSLMELKIKSTFEINSNVQIVYMHKITQILGDRFLNHSLDPNDPKLKQALDRFDEFVVKLFDSEGFVQLSLQSEITVCYERLWLLIEPYMLARIDSCKSILVLDANVWHYMMDETRVKYLHDKAQEAIIKGDLKKAKCYIRPMEAFTLNAQPTLTALPPRRHAVRNIEISYDWYEKYHLPILEKLGLR